VPFHHSRRDNPTSDTARVTIKKISVNPPGRRSSHALASPGTGPEQPAVSGASGHVAQVFGTYNMTDDHYGRTAKRATLLVTATNEILGTHSIVLSQERLGWTGCR
jgi:hypothetical protein